MLNQVIFVGRLVTTPQIKRDENGKEYTEITVAVSRSYKNDYGVYETDFIDCVLEYNIAKQTADYCKVGDIIGIKGRLEKEGNKLTIKTERVTFLSSRKSEQQQEDNNNLSEGEV